MQLQYRMSIFHRITAARPFNFLIGFITILPSFFNFRFTKSHSLGIKPATPGVNVFCPAPFYAPWSPFMPRVHLFLTLSHCLETKGHLLCPGVNFLCSASAKSSPHIFKKPKCSKITNLMMMIITNLMNYKMMV